MIKRKLSAGIFALLTITPLYTFCVQANAETAVKKANPKSVKVKTIHSIGKAVTSVLAVASALGAAYFCYKKKISLALASGFGALSSFWMYKCYDFMSGGGCECKRSRYIFAIISCYFSIGSALAGGSCLLYNLLKKYLQGKKIML